VSAALTHWEGPGHCWCAGKRNSNDSAEPADISVMLSRPVIPENVVIEHVDPSATLDPESMPRDIEVWALIEEHERHEHAYDLMIVQFPNTPHTHPLLRKGFVKIGEFTYEHSGSGDGVYVYKISDELHNISAATEQVIIRAVTNYGADHTCFYRVRLYGEVGEPEDAE
jgi:hypothetical protein